MWPSNATDRVRTAVKKLRRRLGDSAAAPPYIFDEHGVRNRIASPGPPMPDPCVAAVGGHPPGSDGIEATLRPVGLGDVGQPVRATSVPSVHSHEGSP